MGGNDPSITNVEAKDPALDRLIQKTSMRMALTYHAAAGTSTSIHSFGGITFPSGKRTATVELYDPLSNP